jgi:hypothetical protein
MAKVYYCLTKTQVFKINELMEVANHEDEICMLVQFDESSPVLVVNPEGVKPFVVAFERFKV